MLALPVVEGGIHPKEPLVSIGCANGPWQDNCNDTSSQPLVLLTNLEGR